MKSKITQRYDYETFEIPIGEKYRLICCDCSLVHDVVFLIEDGKLFMTAVQNHRSTSQKRRALKEKVNG
jgi:hypothetical protein